MNSSQSTVSPIIAALLALGAHDIAAQEVAQTLPEVTVTGTREKESLAETPSAIGIIKPEAVRDVRPAHPAQIISQVPGAAVAVTNGEGHTTAIRQPFTTNPVYLFLEDGIPIRSTGFFNHNALYETNLPMASGIEVVKGPGTALYGSDAIGGIVNIITRTPPRTPELSLSGDIGNFGWRRFMGGGGNGYANGAWRADLNLTYTDGWRDVTAYDRQSGNLRWDHALGSASTLKTVFGFSRIDQQTGANSPLIYDDYLNNPKRNNFPIAFRKVDALRLSTTYEHEEGDTLVSLTPYARDNSMDLLASFALSFDPTVYTVQNQSVGLLAKWRRDFPQAMRARVIVGADLDYSPGGRKEDRLIVTPTGAGASRVFSSYTVGPRIYDYDVTFQGISPYVHGEISPVDRLRVTTGLRYDFLSYRFDNRFDSTPIQAAGSNFYGQAADTTTTFRHASPKLGATYALAPTMHVFTGYSHGFRAPSEGQIFRPSVATSAAAAQALTDSSLALKPIKADQIEAGLRGSVNVVSYDLAVYSLTKRDDILAFRDTATNFTQTVNAGKTSHRGVELGLGMPFGAQWRGDVAFSYARHKYDEWVTTPSLSGRQIEAAPKILANTRLTWTPTTGAHLQLEWVRIGSYWMDAANTTTYPGHDLFNLRGRWPLAKDLAMFGSIYNLADKRYADSASISSSTPVYSPGLPRTVYAGLEAKW